MNTRLAKLALVCFLPTCTQGFLHEASESVESEHAALGTNPPSEIATWTRVAGGDLPDPRAGQAVAYDSSRKLIMMFGGTAALPGDIQTTRQDLWEWNVTTSEWRERTPAGTKPEARSEAVMVYDPERDRFVMFGGRAGSNLNLEDTWEWSPADGTWTDRTGAGAKPDARARHSMVYDAKRKLVVLFGGGRSIAGVLSSAPDRAEIVSAFASTWEYDPATAIWTDRTPVTTAASPSARYDAGMAWDSQRNLVVLFGGMQKRELTVDGSPKQDTWEWNGESGTWLERTLAGSKPSARFGHGMAYDPGRNKMVVFGGNDIANGQTKNDLWDWEPETGTWTERPVTSSKLPPARIWTSLVLLTGSTPARMMLLAGSTKAGSLGGSSESREPPDAHLLNDVWDLDPATGKWEDRPIEISGPGPRVRQAMATDLETGKVYMFAGQDAQSTPSNDLWVWDGKVWTMCNPLGPTPPRRSDGSMAYDPVRKSLIVFGGMDNLSHDSPGGMPPALADTWEWNIAKATWTQLQPTGSPPGRSGAILVTDIARGKLIMAAGVDYSRQPAPDANGPRRSATLTDVWEWDGSALTWTDVSPPVGWAGPQILSPPIAAWDTARGKLIAVENYTTPQFYEWDPYSHGWASFGFQDRIVPVSGAAFDSARRRMVLLGNGATSDTQRSTLELDPVSSEWYSRPAPLALQQRTMEMMAYDNKRGVVVLFGGATYDKVRGDTWEYKVTGLGNGTGCTHEFASRCESGNCVDGVCCESAACTGACSSCNTPGSLGVCTTAAPGTQVTGSCSGASACDSNGACKAANAASCTSATDCASGFCVDGVCCDAECKGSCTACNLPGRIGRCSPHLAGSDPDKECSKGTPPCTSSCNGVGACAFANYTITCGQCGRCDGFGSCIENYYSFCTNLGSGGSGGTGGSGNVILTGGSGGTSSIGGTFIVGGTSGSGGVGGIGGRVTVGGTGGRGGTSTGGQVRGGISTGGTDSAGLSGSVHSGGTGGRGGSGLTSLSGSSGGTGGPTSTGGVAGASGTMASSGSLRDGGVNPMDGGAPTDDGGSARSDLRIGDGGGPDARPAKLGHSGCGCRLGDAEASQGMSVLWLVGLAWLMRPTQRRDRRGRSSRPPARD